MRIRYRIHSLYEAFRISGEKTLTRIIRPDYFSQNGTMCTRFSKSIQKKFSRMKKHLFYLNLLSFFIPIVSDFLIRLCSPQRMILFCKSLRHTFSHGRRDGRRRARRPHVNEPADESLPDALKSLSADERRSSTKPREKPGIARLNAGAATSAENYSAVRA